MPRELPPQNEVEWSLLKLLENRPPIRVQQVYRELASAMKLSQHQLALVIESGDHREKAWPNLCRFARRRLVDRGWINGRQRGYWSLTSKGQEVAQVRALDYKSYLITLEELGL